MTQQLNLRCLKRQGETFQIAEPNFNSRIRTISSQISIMAEKLIYISTKRIIILASAVGGRLAFLKKPPVKVKSAVGGNKVER